MTENQIQQEAVNRVESMSPTEYQRRAAALRTVTGAYVAPAHRSMRVQPIDLLINRYGDDLQNKGCGKKPKAMKTRLFVLLNVLLFALAIILIILIGSIDSKSAKKVFLVLALLLVPGLHGSFIMIFVSLIRNASLRRRIIISFEEQIDEDDIEAAVSQIIAMRMQVKIREEKKEKELAAERARTKALQMQETNVFAAAVSTQSESARSTVSQEAVYPSAGSVNGQLSSGRPVKANNRGTEAVLLGILQSINAKTGDSHIVETEPVTSPGQILLDRAGIEAEVKRRFEALSPEEYDVIAKPIREKLAVMRSAKKAGANAGKRNNSLLRDYQKASKDVDKMIYYGSKDHTLKESLSVYMISVDRIASGDVIAKGSFKAKNTVIYFGCIAVIIIYLATHSSIRGFESSLCRILGGGSFLASLYFLPRMIDDIKKASVIRRAVKYYGTPEGQEQEIKDRLKVMVYETEQMNHFRNAN